MADNKDNRIRVDIDVKDDIEQLVKLTGKEAKDIIRDMVERKKSQLAIGELSDEDVKTVNNYCRHLGILESIYITGLKERETLKEMARQEVQNELKDKDHQNVTLTRQLEELQNKNTEITEQLKTKDAELSNLSSENSVLRQENEVLKQKEEISKEKEELYKRCSAENKRLITEVQRLNAEIQRQNTEIQRLTRKQK